ncbi:MAG: hypothetical protein GY861_07775 [bacterium]|nr:hypothetical protein [bacterium]
MPTGDSLGSDPEVEQLRRDIKALKNIAPSSDNSQLTDAIIQLTNLLKAAGNDLKAESSTDLSLKIDRMISQNEEIARGILLILELQRQHLPEIVKHTKNSARQPIVIAAPVPKQPEPHEEPILKPLSNAQPQRPPMPQVPPPLPHKEPPKPIPPQAPPMPPPQPPPIHQAPPKPMPPPQAPPAPQPPHIQQQQIQPPPPPNQALRFPSSPDMPRMAQPPIDSSFQGIPALPEDQLTEEKLEPPPKKKRFLVF